MICAHAVSVAVKKIDGVESVEVTLNRGHAEIKLKPGNRVRIEQIWEAVRKQGLTPKEARVVVRGRLDGSKLTVDSIVRGKTTMLREPSGCVKKDFRWYGSGTMK